MREELEIPDILTPEDAVRLGAALSDLVDTDGWKLFEMFMRKREMDLGRHGLRDETKTREYYLGRMDEAVAMINTVDRLVQMARDARTELEGERRTQVRPRLGGGNLAGY